MSVSASFKDLLALRLTVKALMKRNSFHPKLAFFELISAKKAALK